MPSEQPEQAGQLLGTGSCVLDGCVEREPRETGRPGETRRARRWMVASAVAAEAWVPYGDGGPAAVGTSGRTTGTRGRGFEPRARAVVTQA